jgi:hypothetical protein
VLLYLCVDVFVVFVYVCVVECFEQKVHVVTCNTVSVSLCDGFHRLLQLCLHFPLTFESYDLCDVSICNGLQRSYKLLYFALLLFQRFFNRVQTIALIHQLLEFASDIFPHLNSEAIVVVKTHTPLLRTLNAYKGCLFAAERVAKLGSMRSAERADRLWYHTM